MDRRRLHTLLLVGPLAWISSVRGQDPSSPPVDKEKVYYLHCFRPTYGMKPPNTNDREPEKPPEQLLSLRISLGDDFSAVLKRGNRWTKGRLELRDGDLFLDCQGQFGLSVHRYTGAVKPEAIFDPELLGFSGGVTSFRVVISENPEIEPFLKVQRGLDEEKRRAAYPELFKNERDE